MDKYRQWLENKIVEHNERMEAERLRGLGEVSFSVGWNAKRNNAIEGGKWSAYREALRTYDEMMESDTTK